MPFFRNALFLLTIAGALAPQFAGAQQAAAPKTLENLDTLKFGHLIPKADVAATPIPFTQRDFIRFTIEPSKKPEAPGAPYRIHLGEPALFNVRLINHTEFAIVLKTNVHPRASLKVMVQPEAAIERRTYGPYPEGQYTPSELFLYPLEERVTPFVLWGDLQMPGGLVFPVPGKYLLRFELQVAARSSSVSGSIPPVDSSLRPLAPIAVEVLPSPASEAELVNLLAGAKAFPDLQLKRIPAALEGRMEELIAKYPTTAITPYLDYTLGLRAWAKAGVELKDDELFNQAVRHVQRAALAESAVRNEAWLTLIRLYDYRGLGDLAASTAQRFIYAEAPEDMRSVAGSLDYVRRLLVNSTEIDPIPYWPLLEP